MARKAANFAAGMHPLTRVSGRAFTIVELLISIAIVATLLALLLPALGRTIGAARGFRCQMSLRSIAFDFNVFADEQLHGDRGNDPRELGAKRFRLDTFQASQYGLNEFWRWGNAAAYTLPDAANNDPMRCSEIKGPITLSSNTPCSSAIEPPKNISFTFNMRLHRANVTMGQESRLVPVTLSSAILDHPRVPLVWDVDGSAAAARGASPVYSAPAAGGQIGYDNDVFWYPARRHNGAINFALIDGSVNATSQAPAETNWDWSYQPNP